MEGRKEGKREKEGRKERKKGNNSINSGIVLPTFDTCPS